MQNHGTISAQEQSKIFMISPTTQTGNIDTVKKTEPPVDTTKSKNEDSRRIMKCKFCTASHDRGNCPAFGATCHNCNGRNRYARCWFKSKNGTEEIEITSWKARAYGIFTRVGEVSEIERVSAANE